MESFVLLSLILQETNQRISEQEDQISQLNSQLNKFKTRSTHLKYRQLKSSLEQVITKIKELINKPPTFTGNDENLKKELEQAQQTIIGLEKQLQELIPFDESLEVIKEIDINSLKKELDIKFSAETLEKIQQAVNYQEYSFLRNEEIKRHLQQSSNNNFSVSKPGKEIQLPKERIIWIGLLIISWLVIGGLLVKIARSKRKREN